MKFSFKSSFVLAVAMLAAFAVHAEMAQRVLQATVVGTNVTTATATIKGEISAIGIVIPAALTSDVVVVSSEGTTLFTKSGITAGTNWYQVRVPIHSTAGAALSSSVITYGGADQTTTNTFLTYAQIPTVTVTTNLQVVYGTGDVAIATNSILTYNTTWTESIVTNTILTFGFSTASAATNAVAEYGRLAVVGDVTATFTPSSTSTGICSVLINYVK